MAQHTPQRTAFSLGGLPVFLHLQAGAGLVILPLVSVQPLADIVYHIFLIQGMISIRFLIAYRTISQYNIKDIAKVG